MLIDGKMLAQVILDSLRKRVEKLHLKKNITPHLGIILVGTNPASESYVRQKIKMANDVQAVATVYKYPKNISQKELLFNINYLQKNNVLHGLIIQLPLPKRLDETLLLDAVESAKDVDGFKKDSLFKEPISEAVIYILEYIFSLETIMKSKRQNFIARSKTKVLLEGGRMDSFQVGGGMLNPDGIASSPIESGVRNDAFFTWLHSKKIVILGKGKTGGMPIIKALKTKGIGYRIIDSKTQNPSEVIKQADILICAVGNRGVLVNKGIIKKDAILIGIGMHKGEDGKLHGDYNNEDVMNKAKYYTPIPGGVGPVNAAMLLTNVVESAERTRKRVEK